MFLRVVKYCKVFDSVTECCRVFLKIVNNQSEKQIPNWDSYNHHN